MKFIESEMMPVSYTHLDVYKRQDDLLRRIGDQRGVGAQPIELAGKTVQRLDQPAHRIARRIIAPDDQQRDVGEPLHRVQAPHRLAVHHARQQVVARRQRLARFEFAVEARQHRAHFGHPLCAIFLACRLGRDIACLLYTSRCV